MKRIVGLLALLLLSAPLGAQTVIKNLEWDEPESIAVVSTFFTTVKIDAAAAIQVTPTYSTATTPGMLTHGKTPLTLTAGTHTIVLTVTNPSGVSTSAAPFNYNPGVAPGTPVSVTITVTVTVP